jgi:hypothetical protein
MAQDAIIQRLTERRDAFYLEVSDNSSNTTTGQTFKSALIDRYQNIATKHDDGEVKELFCMVSHEAVAKRDCRAGHILPRKSVIKLIQFGMCAFDIHDPRNGILWAKGIEAVFNPAEKVCFIYDFLRNDLRFKVLDSGLLEEIVEGTSKKFKDIDGNILCVPTGADGEKKLPFLRLIWQHAEAAITRACKLGKCSDEEMENYSVYLENSRQWMNDVNSNNETSQEALIGWGRKNGFSRKCVACKVDKFDHGFSRTQIKKGKRNSKCRSCCGSNGRGAAEANQN